MEHLELTFLSLQRTKPGTKTDAVAQPYNNIERLLKFRLAMLKIKVEEIRCSVNDVRHNTFGWKFRRRSLVGSG